MSEDTTKQSQVDGSTATESTDDGAGDGAMSVEELKAELAKVRREAAGRRVANRELEEKAKKYDEWQREQMTEVERLKADLAQAQTTAAEAARERTARSIAREVGLDPDDADLITGKSEDEMRASAERLAARLGARTSGTSRPADGLFGGTRGRPVASHRTKDASQQFLDLFRK